MTKKAFFSKFAIAAMFGAIAIVSPSCNKDEKKDEGKGTLSGTVTARSEDGGGAIGGVSVTVKDGTTSVGTATSGADGKYSVANLPTNKDLKVEFAKTGYQTRSYTLATSKWAANAAVQDAQLLAAGAKITGKVVDTRNANAGLQGVSVQATSSESSGSATTAADGTFTLDNLVKGDYTLTFTSGDLPVVTRQVAAADFGSDDVAILPDVEMGYPFLLGNKTITDLQDAPQLSHFDYAGGGNGYDWSYNYIIAQWGWYGWVESQGEGAALQTPNDASTQETATASEDNFVSFFYGKKTITDNSKVLTLYARTHNASESAPAVFGVQVVDLSQGSAATAVKVGSNQTHYGDAYNKFTFDLSAYTGKEVAIAIGIYRVATGDYWKQLPIRRIAFGPQEVANLNDLVFPGTEVRTGWRLTQEMLPQIAVQTKTSFTGITTVEGPGEGNRGTVGYKSWAEIDHIAKLWQFVYINKDVEPFPNEGYLIKTVGGGATISLELPANYLYAKFAITSANHVVTLKARNFGSNYTFFALTAVTSSTVTNVVPTFVGGTGVEGETGEAVADGNGVFKFKNNGGGQANVDGYATFTYDLTEFIGQEVVLCLGVYKGEDNSDENKLVIHSLTLGD